MSKKYGALGEYLRGQHGDEVPLSFAEIERIIGSALPPNSQHAPAWWSNAPGNNVMTKVWLDAGFKSEKVDIKGRKLVFKRVATDARRDGMSDQTREFKPADANEANPRRHPAWGALKGTFTIEPGWDLTKPAMDPDEWEEILEAKLAKYDRLYADMDKEK
jgi:hypothetical protein